jgi:hypothetical protein
MCKSKGRYGHTSRPVDFVGRGILDAPPKSIQRAVLNKKYGKSRRVVLNAIHGKISARQGCRALQIAINRCFTFKKIHVKIKKLLIIPNFFIIRHTILL